MRVKFISMALIVLLSSAAYIFAEEGHGHHERKGSMTGHEEKGSMMGHVEEEASFAMEVGNEICPVSGEKVGTMGPVVQYEYEGKIYNVCCKMCAKDFKKDPEKYIKIIEDSMNNDVKGSHSDEGHHH